MKPVSEWSDDEVRVWSSAPETTIWGQLAAEVLHLREMWTQERERAERAEAEHEGFKGECIRRHRADLERITELREQYEELERAELARDAMWEKDRAALARVRALQSLALERCNCQCCDWLEMEFRAAIDQEGDRE